MKNQNTTDPSKRITHVGFMGMVTFEYPQHFTNQQRGFTPSGGAKNYFPMYKRQAI